MGRLIAVEFMTLDGVMEAPGFDEHRSGRNAWAIRHADDELQAYNLAHLEAADAILVRPDDLPDLGCVLAPDAAR